MARKTLLQNVLLKIDGQDYPPSAVSFLHQRDPFPGGHKYRLTISAGFLDKIFAPEEFKSGRLSFEDSRFLHNTLSFYWQAWMETNPGDEVMYLLNNIEELEFDGDEVNFVGVCSEVSKGDVRLLIPLSKMDTARAEAAVAASFPLVEPILQELLEWIQDMNWPVAEILAPFLASIGAPLIPHIQGILETDDEIWKGWVINRIMAESVEVATAFRNDLERIAYTPTEIEIEEGLNEYAQLVLEKFAWEK